MRRRYLPRRRRSRPVGPAGQLADRRPGALGHRARLSAWRSAFAGYVAGAFALRRRAGSLAAVARRRGRRPARAADGPDAPLDRRVDVLDVRPDRRRARRRSVRRSPERLPGRRRVRRDGKLLEGHHVALRPAFTLGSEVHARIAGDDPGRAAWLYRATAALAVLATAALAASMARRRPFAAAFVGWNPLLALHFGGGGHNDALMMLLVVGALVIAARGSPSLAGLAWAAAIGIKWVAAAFLVIWAIDRCPASGAARPAGARRGSVRARGPGHPAVRLDLARGIPGAVEPGPPYGLDRPVELAGRPRPRAPNDPRGNRARDAGRLRLARPRGVAPAEHASESPGRSPRSARAGSTPGTRAGGSRSRRGKTTASPGPSPSA